MFVLIGILTICSAGFNHLVAVVKMENWLISFNVYIRDRNSQYFFCVCNLVLYIYLPSFFVLYGWLYSENQCLYYLR